MANTEIRRKANIGSSSLILIFIVLCLATFGILSLGNAQGDELLSARNAAAVKEYYRADGQGEAFVAMVDQALSQAEGSSAAEIKEQVLAALGEYYQAETGHLVTVIPMSAGQAMQVELAVDWAKKSYEVVAWNVFIQEDYEIDQSIPVWTGE